MKTSGTRSSTWKEKKGGPPQTGQSLSQVPSDTSLLSDFLQWSLRIPSVLKRFKTFLDGKGSSEQLQELIRDALHLPPSKEFKQFQEMENALKVGINEADLRLSLSLLPLHTTWWVWIYSRKKDWVRDGKKGFQKFPFNISTMQDFQGFSKLFPSLQEGQYFMFREGIFPEWEDPANRHGGRWSFSIPDRMKLREMWLLLCEGCVAENLFVEYTAQDITGMEVCYKRGYVKIWTRSRPSTPSVLPFTFTPCYKPVCTSIKFQDNESSYQHATKG